MAPNEPVQPASIVFTAIDPMRRAPLPDAPKVLPGLKPNHPKARMKHPVRTTSRSCPGMALGVPLRLYLPIRGPMIIESASAVTPPTACTTPDPAKSQYPCPSEKLFPSCDNHPPPQAQLPKRGYVMAPMKTDDTAKATYFHRSAQEPVTMVNAVSMKTIWKRNRTMTPTS